MLPGSPDTHFPSTADSDRCPNDLVRPVATNNSLQRQDGLCKVGEKLALHVETHRDLNRKPTGERTRSRGNVCQTPNRIGHVMIIWNPANKTTIEARGTRAGVGQFSYANGPSHRIFEIWRVGNLGGGP
jgi:hypothetical protein